MKMRIVVSLFLFTALLSHYSTAQEVNWQRINRINNVHAVAINARDHIFIAATDSVYRSTDEGKNWTRLYTGPTGPSYFHHMVINSRGDVFVCSDQGILRSTDNGDSWTMSQQASAPYGMVVKSLGHLYTAECFRGVLRSIDNGNSWQQVLDSADVHGIVIEPSGEIIAGLFAGRGSRGGYRSTDNGESWQKCSFGFTSLAYNSAGTMFAGTSGTGMWGGTGAPYLFRSTNNGSTWDTVYSKATYDVLVNSDGQIFAGGPSGGIVTSLDNGETWKELNVGLTSDCIYSIQKNSKGEVFAGTEDGVFRSVRTTPIALTNSDFYVDPTGNVMNSGLRPSEPLKSIADALSRMYADSLHPHTVHIANGVYSETETGEANFVHLKSYVSLVGESESGVILGNVQLYIDDKRGVAIENMALVNGAIESGRCDPKLRHLIIKASDGVSGPARRVLGSNAHIGHARTSGTDVEAGTSLHGLRPTLGHVTAKATSVGYGPGIWLSESNACIEDVEVSGTTDEAGILMYGSSPTLYNVAISGNTGWLCGGIRIEENSSPTLVNVTISGNSGGEMGGVICNAGSHPIFVNTIIWNNSLPGIELRAFTNWNCSITFANCDLQGGKENVHVVNSESGIGTINWLEANVDVDPLFVDAKSGDFRLQNGSPCIDAGTPLFVWKGDTLVNINRDQYVGSAPDIGAFEFGRPTGIQTELMTPQSFSLSQNYPNPFNPTTGIRYQVPVASDVKLVVYDILGRDVATLVNQVKEPGTHTVQWDASANASGVYFYRFSADKFSDAKKMMLVK